MSQKAPTNGAFWFFVHLKKCKPSWKDSKKK